MSITQERLGWLEGKPVRFKPNFKHPFYSPFSLFQIRVWKETVRIPYGKTKTYKDIARLIGKPRAYRAVAQALKKNPLPLLIPCHRVVGSNNTLGGYMGSEPNNIKIKQALLAQERI